MGAPGCILCGFEAFKVHCAFHLRGGEALLGDAASDEAMGQFGGAERRRAKAAETRARRLATAVERTAEGKSRNWKYEKC